MKNNKWIKLWLITIIILPTVWLLNYLIDPYQIFHKPKNYHYYGATAVRFLKINYLNKNYNKYNSYMLGSSRIGVTPPFIPEKYIKNSHFYNLWTPSANLGEILGYLKYIKNQKYKIDNIYIGIDINTNIENTKFINKNPYLNNKSIIPFYIEQLSNIPFQKWLDKLNSKASKKNKYSEIDILKGNWCYPNIDNLVQDNNSSYIKNEETFKYSNKRTIRLQNKELLQKKLNEIKIFCVNQNINVIIFITPHHKAYMDSFIIEDYLSFLKIISNYFSFYDFSGYNSITINDTYYYETSHYLPKVSTLIAARIFNDKSIEVPSDFGVFVSKNNIDEHLKNLKEQIQNYDFNKSLK